MSDQLTAHSYQRGTRIAELDCLRGLAILGVLMLHSCFKDRFTQETMAVQTIMARLFDWSVLAFFFSSGYLHERSEPLAVTVKKKGKSLLLPFFLYNAFYLVFFTVIKSMGWIQNVSLEMNFHWLANGLVLSPAFQLYFLVYLFLISTFVGGVDKLPKPYGGRAYWLLLVIVLSFYLIRGYPESSCGQYYSRIPLYLAAFLSGVISRPFFENRFKIKHAWIWAVALLVVLIMLVCMQLPRLSLAVPPLLVGLARTVPKLMNARWLLLMGSMSGSIYLWHTPILLPACTKLLAHFEIPSLVNLFTSIGLTLTVCLLARLGLDLFYAKVLKTRPPRYITL